MSAPDVFTSQSVLADAICTAQFCEAEAQKIDKMLADGPRVLTAEETYALLDGWRQVERRVGQSVLHGAVLDFHRRASWVTWLRAWMWAKWIDRK